MARNTFGGDITAWVFRRNDELLPDLMQLGAGLEVTFWDAPTGGNQYTDLLVDGSPASSVTTSTGTDGRERGALPVFEGPDDAGVTSMWAQVAGASARYLIHATNVGERVVALEGKLVGVHNIRDYGAVGDGVTDDLEAIQDAIEAAEADGGRVLIPRGTYVVSGTPEITVGGIIIEGEGPGSKILLAPASMNPDGTTIGLWVNGASNVVIRNLNVDGNFANIAKSGTFHGSSPLWDPVIAEYGPTSVKVYAMGGSGVDAATYLLYRAPIRISDAHNVLVEGCWIANSVSAGILVDGAAVDACTDIMIRNCRVWLTWDNGIYFHQGVRWGSAVGNHCSDTQYSGIASIYCDDIHVVGNVVRNGGPSASDSAGIELCGVVGGTIVGNRIHHCQFAGIELKATEETAILNGLGGLSARNSNILVQGNLITDCRSPSYPTNISAGVRTWGSDDTMIVGNKIDQCDYGIDISNNGRNVGVAVLDNVVRRCTGVGIEVGNSPDNTDIVVSGNLIEQNGSNGISGYAPAIYRGNTIRRNNGQGINLADCDGLPYGQDIIEGNVFADNLFNGVGATASPGKLAVVRNNEFYNSDTLTFSDGVIAATDNTFQSASANFGPGDVGTVIVILGASGAAGEETLVTTIASVTNETTVELTEAPDVSRTGTSFLLLRGRQVFFDGAIDGDRLTSDTALFTAEDQGLDITVWHGFGPNARILFQGTIASVEDASTVTLSGSPGDGTSLMFAIQRGRGIQERAIWNDGDSDVHFVHNRIWGMRTQSYNPDAFTDNSVFRNNDELGSVGPVYDRMAGRVTIGAAETSVVVTHQLAQEPWAGAISVIPLGTLGAATHFWVSDIDGDSFQINVDAAPGVDVTFGWRAEVGYPSLLFG